jgi:hypothetical protein
MSIKFSPKCIPKMRFSETNPVSFSPHCILSQIYALFIELYYFFYKIRIIIQ